MQFSPALSTLSTALTKGYLTNFPGLSLQLLRKHPPHSVAMVKGHLDQTRKNQRSTQAPAEPSPTDTDDSFPSNPPELNDRSHFCYAAIMEPTGQIYTDQTGQFITPSSNGNNYLIVLYDYDSNTIFAQPLITCTGKAILAAYKILHTKLCRTGFHPKLQHLDNECSEILKDFMTNTNIDFQLIPPGVHHRNAAEGAICTFKNHFIAGLCSVDKDFPLHLWDHLLPQALLTLNLLRSS